MADLYSFVPPADRNAEEQRVAFTRLISCAVQERLTHRRAMRCASTHDALVHFHRERRDELTRRIATYRAALRKLKASQDVHP